MSINYFNCSSPSFRELSIGERLVKGANRSQSIPNSYPLPENVLAKDLNKVYRLAATGERKAGQLRKLASNYKKGGNAW